MGTEKNLTLGLVANRQGLKPCACGALLPSIRPKGGRPNVRCSACSQKHRKQLEHQRYLKRRALREYGNLTETQRQIQEHEDWIKMDPDLKLILDRVTPEQKNRLLKNLRRERFSKLSESEWKEGLMRNNAISDRED
jgi:hypothetical protein